MSGHCQDGLSGSGECECDYGYEGEYVMKRTAFSMDVPQTVFVTKKLHVANAILG